MADPVIEFLKYAKAIQVKGHVREESGKHVSVRPHSRSAGLSKAEEEVLLEAKKARELELWMKWKSGGEQPADLRPLLKSFLPMIKSKENAYKGRIKMIPDSAIESEFRLRFVDAMRSYDPSKGSLGTYVFRYLDKAKRFIVENQNVGRIPENRIYKIRAYKFEEDRLREELGAEPTKEQLAKRLGWPLQEVERMESELRNDYMTQGFEDDPYSLAPSKAEEVLKLFKYELEGAERDVYEHITGYGKPRLSSTGAIAQATGIPDYQVSRIKGVLHMKLKKYLYESRIVEDDD